jgi:hypothetical protein
VCMFWQLLAVLMPAGGRSSGCAVAGVIAVEEAGEHVDGFEQQRVGLGLLVSGVLSAVARDEPVPPGGCLLLVLGSLVPGLVAGLPPAQCLSAGRGQAGLLVSLG